MRLRTALGAAIFAGLGLTSAGAQPTPVAPSESVSAPNWTAGSNWYYSDGYALKVESASPGDTKFDRLDAPGQWFTRQGFLRKDLVSGTATRTGIYRTAPEKAGLTLSAGKPLTFQREYLSNGKLMVHASSWSLEGRETITVPAGTFDCWIIVWRTRSLRSDWTGFERWWYSPVAQSYVRMEYKYGSSPAASRVLMRYQLSGALQPTAAPALPFSGALQVQALPPPILPDIGGKKSPSSAAQNLSVAPKDDVQAVVAPSPSANRRRGAKGMPALVLARAPLEQIPDQPEAAPAEPEMPTAIQAAAPAAAESKTGNGSVWHAQIGSSANKALLKKSLAKALHSPVLRSAHLPSNVIAAEKPGQGTFYRAWLGTFTTYADAVAMCKTLVQDGTPCTVLRIPGKAAG